MKVLVDTSVWSLAFRKKTLNHDEKKIVSELGELIKEFRVVIFGSIRQELLSGISDNDIYKKLKSKMKAFEDLPSETEDFEKASELSNKCRKSGIQGSHIDFLICSMAINRNVSIFTTDKDFINYNKILNIKLHKIRYD